MEHNASKKKNTLPPKNRVPVSDVLVKFLDGKRGAAHHFADNDDGLVPAVISKMKHGRLPITFEHAVRLERAQPASDKPFKAEEICSYAEDRSLIEFLRNGGITAQKKTA